MISIGRYNIPNGSKNSKCFEGTRVNPFSLPLYSSFFDKIILAINAECSRSDMLRIKLNNTYAHEKYSPILSD